MIVDEVADLGDTIGYHDWDGHAEDFELPSKDLVGLLGFSLTQNGKFHDFTFAVGISTHQDPGIHRLTKLVDRFYERLASEQRYAIRHPQTGAPMAWAVCFDGTSATPMARVDARPTQTVMCSGRLTLT